MRRATCELVADTSKFDGPIDRAKAKLSSFGQAVSGIVSAVERTANVFNTLVGVADGIQSIKRAFDIVKEASVTAVNAMKNFPVIMEKVKSVASSAVSAIRNIHPALLAVGAGGIVVAGTMFGLVKAFQGVISISKSVAVSIKNVASSLASISSRAISSVGSGVMNAFRGMTSAIKTAGIALGGLGISLGALDRFFKIGITSAIQLGDSMKTLSARTGASIPFLVDMQKLFKNSGISADYAGNAMLNMQRALSGVNADGEPTNQMFERLGLSVENLMQMSPEQQFKIIGSAIANLKTESEKTAAAFAIFGRQGGGLKAVFKDPAFQTLGVNLSQLGVSLEKNADNFSKISAKLRDSGSFFRGFFVEMAGAVAPSILELFKIFESGDFLTGFGKKLGDQIAFGVNAIIGAFRGGEIFSLLKLSFETSTIVLRDLLSRTFQYTANIFSAILSGSALPVIGVGLLDIFSGSVKAFGSMLLKVFETPLAYFQAGLEIAVASIALKFDAIFKKFSQIGEGFARGGAFGAAAAATKILFEPAEGLSDEEKGRILSERLQEGVKFGVAELEVSSRSAEGALTQIGDGVKKVFEGMQIAGKELQSVLSLFPPQSEEAKSAISKFSDEFKRLSSLGAPAEKTISEATGTATLGAPRGRAESAGRNIESAVSSLRRIGGGGGAFVGGDPLLRNAERQTTLQEKMANELEKANKRAEKGGGLTLETYGKAVLA